jgi:hypothetical protein
MSTCLFFFSSSPSSANLLKRRLFRGGPPFFFFLFSFNPTLGRFHPYYSFSVTPFPIAKRGHLPPSFTVFHIHSLDSSSLPYTTQSSFHHSFLASASSPYTTHPSLLPYLTYTYNIITNHGQVQPQFAVQHWYVSLSNPLHVSSLNSRFSC